MWCIKIHNLLLKKADSMVIYRVPRVMVLHHTGIIQRKVWQRRLWRGSCLYFINVWTPRWPCFNLFLAEISLSLRIHFDLESSKMSAVLGAYQPGWTTAEMQSSGCADFGLCSRVWAWCSGHIWLESPDYNLPQWCHARSSNYCCLPLWSLQSPTAGRYLIQNIRIRIKKEYQNPNKSFKWL